MVPPEGANMCNMRQRRQHHHGLPMWCFGVWRHHMVPCGAKQQLRLLQHQQAEPPASA